MFAFFSVPGFVSCCIDMLKKKKRSSWLNKMRDGLHIWHAETSCVQREAGSDPHMILGVGSEAFSSPCH